MHWRGHVSWLPAKSRRTYSRSGKMAREGGGDGREELGGDPSGRQLRGREG